MRFIFGRLFPLPFILAGACTLYFGCRNLHRARESTTWPTTEGVVRQSSVEYHRSDEGGGTYHAEVMYEFSVEGTTFSSDRVTFGDYGSSSPSHARRIVNAYPAGKNVTVYYTQDDPEVSVLEPGIKGHAWFLPVFGAIFLVVGCLMAVGLPRLLRKMTTVEPGPEDDSLDAAP